MEQTEARPVLDRVEQRRRYGLDCGDSIRFDAGSWSPGGEHLRQLIVRNVSQRTIKFKYELPRTKYFSMNFPTVMTLSPGMLTTLDVAFRPVKLEEYDDFVGFHVHVIEGGVAAVSGHFRVPVVARIAALKVEIPHGVDFGFCPTKETTIQSFTLHNCGQIDAIFDWTVPAAGEHGRPFAVRPEYGKVKAGGAIELTASFCPSSASVYVTITACSVKADTNDSFISIPARVETMKISGISKFTHLSASETELNFGEMLVGAPNTSRAPTEKEFILRNRSLVRASFSIENVESDHDPRFFFSPLNGVVEAESTAIIKVRYIPLSAGTFTCDHFDIITPGGNRVRITCKGRAIGPTLSIWRKNVEANFVPTQSVNFQDVFVGGKVVSRAITLRNESPIEIFFHFDAQAHGVFCFDQVTGRIPPFLDLSVTISFSPPQAGNFYRRFFLLIHNQSMQYVDVLGTGYDDKTRPSPFQQAHVDAYRLRASAGLGRLSPDQLEAYHEDNGDAMFLKGALHLAKAQDPPISSDFDSSSSQFPPPSRLFTRSGETSLAHVEVCSEYFISIEDKANPVVVLGALLDFGNCGIVQFPSKKNLLVTNNTHSKVTCSWRVAVAPGLSQTSDDQSVFQVFPPTADIAAGATAEFRVAFQPSRVYTYYFAELEAFVSFKSNRTFRLVNVDTFTPPWCMVAKTCGNTFTSPTEQFLPKITFRLMRNKVQFPPCYLGDSVFQTIMIENASDTPALFEFVEDPTEVFSCKPSCGYIEAKSFHLVAIQFTPRKVKIYSHFLHCVVNNARAQPEILELTAICALPQLSFQDIEAEQLLSSDVKVFVKPTAVGLQSLKHIELINTSRVPLVYRWELPSQYLSIFRVTPKLGRLNGRETAVIECSFTPSEIREYASRFLVAVKSISIPLDQRKNLKSSIPVVQELTVRVQTKGTTGAILFLPETLKFDTILVNSSSKQVFFLENTADCDLMYSLKQFMVSKTQKTRENDPNSEDGDGIDAPVGKLVFSQAEGCIPAQSRKKITATFLPTSAGSFTFKVSCTIGDQMKASPYETWKVNQLKEAICIIHAEASFPTIEIEDLRVPGVTTQLAWHQFQCSEINEYLAAPLTKEEEKQGRRSSTVIGNIESGFPESEELEDEFALKRFAIPFSPAPFNSQTERVFIKLRNPGSLVVQYHLRYPKEGNVEIEHWAETGAPSADELRLNAIIDSKVFGISPRSATLLPRQSIVLTLSYSYTSETYEGEHILPLSLEVDKGKKIVLELQGRTLTRKDPKLFLPTQIFHLSPVTIGEFRQGFQPPLALRASSDYESEYSPQLRTGRPPVQQVEVFNRGESALRLDIGSVSFKQLNAKNFGYRVLHCANNSEIIPAKGSVFLDIEFNPIKAGTIEVPLLLKAHGLMAKGYKEMAEITIVATGYHPRQWTLQQMKNELWASTSPPKRQILSIPDLPACFVVDCIDFGHVSMHSEVNQLLVLQNESSCSDSGSNDVISRNFVFEWDTLHPLITNGTLEFSPKRGELGPGEKVLIRVTVHTGSDAFVVNHDVACLITYSSEEKEVKSNNTTSMSPRQFKTQSSFNKSSKRSMMTQSYINTSNKTRTSVVNRSIATQEAVIDKRASSTSKLMNLNSNDLPGTQAVTAQRTSHSSSRKTLSQSTRRRSPERSGGVSSSESRHLESFVDLSTTSLFVRISAHVLSVEVMERIYPREKLKTLPLQATKQIPRVLPVSAPTIRDVKTPSLPSTRDNANTPIRTGRGIASSKGRTGTGKLSGSQPGTGTGSRGSILKDEGAAAKCRDVLYDVMETLVMDVLTSSAIQEVFQEQLEPRPRSDRALVHAENLEFPEELHRKTRQNEDCQAIVADVMENTVFNVLQELFYGDLEHQLLCVPRKTVFPNAITSSSSAASHSPAIDTEHYISNGHSLLKT